jgi:hypothetical protein
MAALAKELAAVFYSGVSGVFVRIVFQGFRPGYTGTAGKAAATAALTVLIRTGRSIEDQRVQVKRLKDVLKTAIYAR